MIADQVEIANLYILHDIEVWCAEHVGPMAASVKRIDRDRPWFRQWNYGNTVWYFADVESATLFRLRWL
jgi:hypothetical protein